MRFHTNTLTYSDLHWAARLARVQMDATRHGSKSRDHAFEVKLTGESNRRPNLGTARYVDRFDNPDRAATWDQWGVFIALLFDKDPSMTTAYYKDFEDYAFQTSNRFGAPEDMRGEDGGYYSRFVSYGWPEDAHGDHTFRYSGTPGQQTCTKCSATKRWVTAVSA